MRSAAALTWFARHELRLAWREWLAMMTGGRRGRKRAAIIGLLIFAALMHLPAYAVIGKYADLQTPLDEPALIVITATIFLAWTLMLSQAIESVTRVFYARSDLDLIMSSPVRLANVFSVRLAAIALTVTAMALLFATPFVDVLVFGGGIRWLAAYGVVIAIGVSAAAVAIAVTIMLFRLIGPSRTRLVAQILAAVIGAGFVIGLQLAAIVSHGTLSRLAFLASEPIVAIAPDIGSVLWWPARALLGNVAAVAAMLGAGILLLAAAIAMVAPRFADCAIAAAGSVPTITQQRRPAAGFRSASPRAVLRRKEWTLLRRDPWLVSQTLMQLLYLLPPAFLLWRGFGSANGSQILLVPVLVMAAGQLAGGLAWLAISGEDAPELVATAPLNAGTVLRAKVEAVMGSILMVFLPFILALAWMAPFYALVAGIGIAIAAASATEIQLCFRAQAKRSAFRRRQTSSRVATFAEAFVSIAWAATAALAASGTSLAAMPGVVAVGILASAHLFNPHKA